MEPQDLTAQNALGEDFEGLPLLEMPEDYEASSGLWSDIKTFFGGAVEGIKNESILGKLFKGAGEVVTGATGVVKDITNTTKLLPVVFIAAILFVGFYLLMMGKRGKAVV